MISSSRLCAISPLMLALAGCPSVPKAEPPPGRETVLLLHGMGRTSRSMRRLHAPLEQAGYRVTDWGYSSYRGILVEHVDRLIADLRALDADPSVARIHIVTHSLGGIITRAALCKEVPSKMGRVVMLAPPHRGSAVARRTSPYLGWLMKPLADLSDAPGSAVNRMSAPAGVEIGIIAAERDGKVRVQDTHLAGEADHLVVPGYHTFIMNSPQTHAQVVEFLRNGRFLREPASSGP